MQLIGMLDSPYVRRTAISLRMLGIPFDNHPLSVFGDFAAFQHFNPLVKAPTLICSDGTVLMDSTLIIDYAETLAGRSLMPGEPDAHRRALRLAGLGLVACEKAIQRFYELKRLPAMQDPVWLARVTAQLHAACTVLDAEVKAAPTDGWLCAATPTQADITVGVTWTLTQIVVADVVHAADYPAFAAFAARAERLPEFVALPPA